MRYFTATVTLYFVAEDKTDNDDIYIHTDDVLEQLPINYRVETVKECDHDYRPIA